MIEYKHAIKKISKTKYPLIRNKGERADLTKVKSRRKKRKDKIV